MPIWTCDRCGGRAHGFEGERGFYVGHCDNCGKGYGGLKDRDISLPPKRVYYRADVHVTDTKEWTKNFKTEEDMMKYLTETFVPTVPGTRLIGYFVKENYDGTEIEDRIYYRHIDGYSVIIYEKNAPAGLQLGNWMKKEEAELYAKNAAKVGDRYEILRNGYSIKSVFVTEGA